MSNFPVAATTVINGLPRGPIFGGILPRLRPQDLVLVNTKIVDLRVEQLEPPIWLRFEIAWHDFVGDVGCGKQIEDPFQAIQFYGAAVLVVQRDTKTWVLDQDLMTKCRNFNAEINKLLDWPLRDEVSIEDWYKHTLLPEVEQRFKELQAEKDIVLEEWEKYLDQLGLIKNE